MKALPRPTIRERFLDDGFTPELSAMCIDWPHNCGESTERVWHLPEGVKLVGPVPVRFGIRIQRDDAQRYDVELLWNNMRLHWSRLTPSQLLAGSLRPLLVVLDMSMDRMLAQAPIISHLPARAA